ncbi:glycosyltransferase [Kushneria aurantia]|uniref:Glycosyltransferase n=1 Tax=Kushneria aurantia TaxID=504092 RepID=A0ABV6G5C5_9GAMM|nr:glycosyltransferase [Kushneria aurantia]
MKFQKDFFKNSIYFDEDWYQNFYLDMCFLSMSPVEHFQKYGMRMLRVGSPLFDEYSKYYSYIEYKQHELQEARKLRFSVEDLIKKLKAGFQSLSLHLLNDVVEDSKCREAKERLSAAWELAKAYATLGKWENVEFYFKKIRYLDPAFARKKKPKLLEVEALTRIGSYNKAHERLSYSLSKRVDGDFLCAKSNLLFLQEVENDQRLSTINKLYSAFMLSPLVKKDSQLPFEFLNLDSITNNEVESETKISILMPVYNAEAFLELSVGSLLAQTYKNIEIIAVDDKSTDDSYAILLKLAASDDRLKVYQNKENSGAYPTRNRALHLSTGDVVTVHDSDDWSHPQMLEKQFDKLAGFDTKITFSFMVRVSADLEFSLRPERNNMEYIHRSYPSLMIRRKDLDVLGEWDAITANADDEFVQRARIVFGNESIVDVLPEVPMSFFLKHQASLTSDPKTSLKSLDYGVRKEYALQAQFWRVNQEEYFLQRGSSKYPFPVPNGLDPKKRNRIISYDVVIISDLSLLGGTRRCNQAYIETACSMGLKVGLFHWPRYDLKLVPDIAKEYRELSFRENVDILTWEEEIDAECVIIHHPPILKYEPDQLPCIHSKKLAILVNQSPKQLYSQEAYYYSEENVEELCYRLFKLKPVWVSISPSAREVLLGCGFYNVSEEIWYPPLMAQSLDLAELYNFSDSSRLPVIGRHARDHWTKWPSTRDKIKTAYLVNKKYEVRLLGGASHALKILGFSPQNWKIFPFDSIEVADFLEQLDFFVHFTNEDYIEEFGRNIAEAMAAGVVVILPRQFESTFGKAAYYCKPEEVESAVEYIWQNPEEFNNLRESAVTFIKDKMSRQQVVDRLNKLLS